MLVIALLFALCSSVAPLSVLSPSVALLASPSAGRPCQAVGAVKGNHLSSSAVWRSTETVRAGILTTRTGLRTNNFYRVFTRSPIWTHGRVDRHLDHLTQTRFRIVVIRFSFFGIAIFVLDPEGRPAVLEGRVR